MFGTFDPGQLALPGVFVVVMEESIPFSLKPAPLECGQVLHGGLCVVSHFPREAYDCSLLIQSVSGALIEGSFMVNQIHAQTTAFKTPKRSAIIKFVFQGQIMENGTISVILEWVHRLPWIQDTIPSDKFTLRYVGNIWIGFYTEPKPGCFYLALHP
jgi:hypothetical protein